MDATRPNSSRTWPAQRPTRPTCSRFPVRARPGAGAFRPVRAGIRLPGSGVPGSPEPRAVSTRGCALGYVMDAAPHLPGQHPALLPQLAACYREWTPEIRDETRLTPKHGESWSGAPARLAVAFYQRQIAPAIGSRCSLHPSCSRYATEALRKHGLLGMALVADRGVREPDVVSRRQDPITVNGRIRYHDPLAAHDGWMKAR